MPRHPDEGIGSNDLIPLFCPPFAKSLILFKEVKCILLIFTLRIFQHEADIFSGEVQPDPFFLGDAYNVEIVDYH